MVEPMLGLAVGLPSGMFSMSAAPSGELIADVWALGVLLYKLCYYTTPFEEHGTLAIVNAKYTFPQYPLYSPKLQHLIGGSYDPDYCHGS
jgi:AP2-associated kinase